MNIDFVFPKKYFEIVLEKFASGVHIFVQVKLQITSSPSVHIGFQQIIAQMKESEEYYIKIESFFLISILFFQKKIL